MSRGAGSRLLLVLPLALVATVLPVVRPVEAPRIRRYALPLDAQVGPLRAPSDFGLVGVSWPSASSAPAEVRVRTSRDGKRWSRWSTIEPDPDEGPDVGQERPATATEPVWVGRSRFVDVAFPDVRPAGARVELIDPGADPAPPLHSAFASPSKPGIITRAGWGADESIRKGNPEYSEPLRLAVVHHTATTDTYDKSESDDIVRAIYAYHVKTNGWDDIGYNFLVDRYGQIFEGRFGGIDRTVTGAHALGFNKSSAGISVIGNFASALPPEAAMNSLKRILAWRLDQGFVDPLSSLTYVSNGSSLWPPGTKVPLKAIAGHRSLGKTECPADPLFKALPYLREAAAKDGAPKLYEAKVSRLIVTPNADGVADGVKLTGRFSSAVSWTVDVVDASGSKVRSVSGYGTTLSVNWYGKDAAGAAVRHGTYRYRVGGKNSLGTVRTAYVPFEVWRYPNGTFLQTKTSKTTYVLEKGVLRHPSNWKARSTRYRSAEVVPVADGLTKAYAKGSTLGFRDGSVVSVDDELSVISEGKRRPTTRTVLLRHGFDADAIIETTSGAVAPHPTGETFSSTDGYPNGATLKGSTGQEAWMLAGIARPFFSRSVRTSWQVRDVDLAGPADAEISEGLSSEPLGFRDGTLVRVADAATVYIISDGRRRPFSSSAVFARMGYKSANVRTVTAAELALHPEGKPL